jgi:hypothetical protein
MNCKVKDEGSFILYLSSLYSSIGHSTFINLSPIPYNLSTLAHGSLKPVLASQPRCC